MIFRVYVPWHDIEWMDSRKSGQLIRLIARVVGLLRARDTFVSTSNPHYRPDYGICQRLRDPSTRTIQTAIELKIRTASPATLTDLTPHDHLRQGPRRVSVHAGPRHTQVKKGITSAHDRSLGVGIAVHRLIRVEGCTSLAIAVSMHGGLRSPDRVGGASR